jgi:hypothetical protein
MAYSAPDAKTYCTDGYNGYLDVVYSGKHVRNIRDKSDTHNVESINADIRDCLAGLHRRSRCFFRSIETFEAAFDLFAEVYNAFGAYKLKYRQPTVHRKPDGAAAHLHHFKDLPWHIADFVDVL